MQAYLYSSSPSLNIYWDFVVHSLGSVVVEQSYPKTSTSTYVVGAGLQVAIAAYNSENITIASGSLTLPPSTEVVA